MSIELVKQMYSAFFEGDTPKALSLISEECQWDHRGPPGPPFNKLYVGPAGVEEFFGDLAESLESKLEFNEWFEAEDRVVVLGFAHHRAIATGKEYGGDFALSHTVQDGQITKWNTVFDMTEEAEAFRP
jgi:ketosteroid isomerase-like protein